MEFDFSQPAPKPTTLSECHALIDALWQFCGQLQREVTELKLEFKNEILVLKKENAELKEKLNTNSSNSSKSPSSDIHKIRKLKKKNKSSKNKSTRKQGGQPGHVGTTRLPLPLDQVDHVISYMPPTKCECGDRVQKSNDFNRHQVHELPIVKPMVTEYQAYYGICCGCGKKHCAEFPASIPSGMLGTVAMAKVATLTGNYRLSKRNTVNLLQDFYGLDISIGTISNVEKIVSSALKAPYEEAAQYIPKQPVVYADETGHKEQNQRMWTWVAATSTVCVFFIRKGRKMAVAQEILGKFFSGILVSDRYSAYNWVDFRQFCWAHLKRDFKKISERSGSSGRIGDGLLTYLRKMFMYWQWVKDGKLKREKFVQLMAPIRRHFEILLAERMTCGSPKTERTCKNILDYKDFLWTFIEKIGVEPTNNLSERLLRRFVIWRKTSFGTQSECGSRFMERIMTVAATCKLQKLNVLDFTSKAIQSYLNKEGSPSLLPTLALPLAA